MRLQVKMGTDKEPAIAEETSRLQNAKVGDQSGSSREENVQWSVPRPQGNTGGLRDAQACGGGCSRFAAHTHGKRSYVRLLF